MHQRHKNRRPGNLARSIEDEVHSMRHVDHVETLLASKHMARDVGLDGLGERPRRHRPWFLPF